MIAAIWEEIKAINDWSTPHLAFQQVFSHCGVYGNEVADKLAEQGAKKGQQGILPTFKDTISWIMRRMKEKWMSEMKVEGNYRLEKYGKKPAPKKEDLLERKEASLCSQCRCGKCFELGTEVRKILPHIPCRCRCCSTRPWGDQSGKEQECNDVRGEQDGEEVKAWACPAQGCKKNFKEECKLRTHITKAHKNQLEPGEMAQFKKVVTTAGYECPVPSCKHVPSRGSAM
jgi:hypothetical protein